MLDELYKTAVVSITEKYQKGQPAIMVAKDIFKAMENGRYHSARLVDATGSPLGEGNVPKTDFEKRAAAAMQAGQTYIEEVAGKGQDRRLSGGDRRAGRAPALRRMPRGQAGGVAGIHPLRGPDPLRRPRAGLGVGAEPHLPGVGRPEATSPRRGVCFSAQIAHW